MTARQIISARLGRDIGPLATMPRDLRRALLPNLIDILGTLTDQGFGAKA